jgi:hypothetical protein
MWSSCLVAVIVLLSRSGHPTASGRHSGVLLRYHSGGTPLPTRLAEVEKFHCRPGSLARRRVEERGRPSTSPSPHCDALPRRAAIPTDTRGHTPINICGKRVKGSREAVLANPHLCHLPTDIRVGGITGPISSQTLSLTYSLHRDLQCAVSDSHIHRRNEQAESFGR